MRAAGGQEEGVGGSRARRGPEQTSNAEVFASRFQRHGGCGGGERTSQMEHLSATQPGRINTLEASGRSCMDKAAIDWGRRKYPQRIEAGMHGMDCIVKQVGQAVQGEGDHKAAKNIFERIRKHETTETPSAESPSSAATSWRPLRVVIVAWSKDTQRGTIEAHPQLMWKDLPEDMTADRQLPCVCCASIVLPNLQDEGGQVQVLEPPRETLRVVGAPVHMHADHQQAFAELIAKAWSALLSKTQLWRTIGSLRAKPRIGDIGVYSGFGWASGARHWTAGELQKVRSRVWSR